MSPLYKHIAPLGLNTSRFPAFNPENPLIQPVPPVPIYRGSIGENPDSDNKKRETTPPPPAFYPQA